jgi:hypothetical protein
VAVLHAWRTTSETHVVAPVQLLAHGDGSVYAGAIAHALSEDTPRVRPVHPDTPPPTVGSTPVHPDGHAGLAVIEPVLGRDPTDRDEMPTGLNILPTPLPPGTAGSRSPPEATPSRLRRLFSAR